jgi:hypothetical protein
MALESATYISDLVSTNPTLGDPVAQGDDQLRLIKGTLQTTFPDASAPIYGLRAKTAQSASGAASYDFTSIPSWVTRITVMIAGLSTNGISPYLVQLGDSGGIEATGYLGSVVVLQDVTAVSGANITTGIGLAPVSVSAGTTYHGTVTLNLLNSVTNTWVASVVGGVSNAAASFVGSFSKSTSATLDRIRITTAGGTDLFDNGSLNVLYE